MRAAGLALVVLGLLAGACTGPVERITEALTVTPSTGPGSGSGGETPEPTTARRPPITVRAPRPGDAVVSPVRIEGSADVSGTTLGVRILDASGLELAAVSLAPTCGSACRGPYAAELSFFVPRQQAGVIEVFEVSVADGSPLNLVRVPVVLVPAG